MPGRRLAAATALAAACMLGVATPVFAAPIAGQREIEEQLTCQCGCGLTVASCNHLECGFAVPARKRIAEALAAGQTSDQIIDGFKKEYGEKVLSSPVPEGFNILAWIAPYASIVVAGTVMFVFFRRRAARATAAPSIATPLPAARAADERLERLRQEVEDLER